MIMQFYRVPSIPVPWQKGVCYVTRDGTHAKLHFVSKDGNSIHTVGNLAGGISDEQLGTIMSAIDAITPADGGVPMSAAETMTAINNAIEQEFGVVTTAEAQQDWDDA